MRNFYKHLFRTFLFASVCSFSITGYANGSGASGGGMGIIYSSGNVRLLDLLLGSELPSKSMEPNSINNVFFKRNRYVKKVAREIPYFFNCAIQKFDQFKDEIPTLSQAVKSLQTTEVLAVEFRLITGTNSFLEAKPAVLPFVAPYSPSAPQAIQEPLASFVNGRIWVSARFYNALSSSDQCGLSIHESLRLINFGGFLRQQLSTKEIEVATRYLMEKSFPEDNYKGVVQKLKQANPTADQYRQLSYELLNKSKELSNYRFKNWDKLTQKQRDKIENEEWELLNQSSEANSNAVMATLNSPQINKYIMGPSIIVSSAIKIGLTSELGAFEYFDTILNKIVYRP
jgi:hypothetical protein